VYLRLVGWKHYFQGEGQLVSGQKCELACSGNLTCLFQGATEQSVPLAHPQGTDHPVQKGRPSPAAALQAPPPPLNAAAAPPPTTYTTKGPLRPNAPAAVAPARGPHKPPHPPLPDPSHPQHHSDVRRPAPAQGPTQARGPFLGGTLPPIGAMGLPRPHGVGMAVGGNNSRNEPHQQAQKPAGPPPARNTAATAPSNWSSGHEQPARPAEHCRVKIESTGHASGQPVQGDAGRAPLASPPPGGGGIGNIGAGRSAAQSSWLQGGESWPDEGDEDWPEDNGSWLEAGGSDWLGEVQEPKRRKLEDSRGQQNGGWGGQHGKPDLAPQNSGKGRGAVPRSGQQEGGWGGGAQPSWMPPSGGPGGRGGGEGSGGGMPHGGPQAGSWGMESGPPGGWQQSGRQHGGSGDQWGNSAAAVPSRVPSGGMGWQAGRQGPERPPMGQPRGGWNSDPGPKGGPGAGIPPAAPHPYPQEANHRQGGVEQGVYGQHAFRLGGPSSRGSIPLASVGGKGSSRPAASVPGRQALGHEGGQAAPPRQLPPRVQLVISSVDEDLKADDFACLLYQHCLIILFEYW